MFIFRYLCKSGLIIIKTLDFGVSSDRFRDAGPCPKAGEKVSKTIWVSSILTPRAGR